jgi:hypothetical protein
MSSPVPSWFATRLAVALAVTLTGSPAFAALEPAVAEFLAAETDLGSTRQEPRPLFVAPRVVIDPEPQAPIVPPTPASPLRLEPPSPDLRPFGSRPGDGALVPLYTSFVALQGFDVHSTLRALDRGGREANSFMAPFTRRPAAFIALKAGTTAGILYLTERVRRRSPTAAIVMMAAFNSAYVTVVANNYRLGNQLGRR